MTGIVTWAKERFDGAAVFSTVLLYFTVAIPARVFHHSEHKLLLQDLIGALMLVSFFLLLRIFDEHKDYAEDLVIHPQRTLSRGVVTLTQLKKLGYWCFAFQIIVTLIFSSAMTSLFYILSFGWGLLMLKEFFVRRWLKDHLFLYVLSHMFIAALVALWIMSFAGLSLSEIQELWPLALLPFVMGFLYELCRKSFGLDEDARIESYLKVFGQPRLIALLALLGILAYYLYFEIFARLGGTRWAHAILLFYILIAAGWKKYLASPCLKNRKNNQAATGLAILLIYSFLIFDALILV